MTTLSRRTLLGAAAGALATPALGQNTRAATLRFVPQANLTALDPIWTTATVTGNHGYYVFDTLYANDAEGRAAAADGGGARGLGRRQALAHHACARASRFHDGEPVRAADCVASLKRWATRDPFGQLLAAVGRRVARRSTTGPSRSA